MKFLSKLLHLAAKSDYQMKHAAIVLRGGVPVASAENHGGRHAEKRALSKLWPSKREGTSIISIRVRKDGTLGMAFPCDACYKFLRENGVGTVYYSDGEGGFGTHRI